MRFYYFGDGLKQCDAYLLLWRCFETIRCVSLTLATAYMLPHSIATPIVAERELCARGKEGNDVIREVLALTEPKVRTNF